MIEVSRKKARPSVRWRTDPRQGGYFRDERQPLTFARDARSPRKSDLLPMTVLIGRLSIEKTNG